MPADCEPPSGPCLPSAARYGASSRPVGCGHPIVSHSHKPGLAGSSGEPVCCEPPSGPCLRFLQSGHIAERWRLEPDEELDGRYADGRRKQVDCEPPADPNLLQAVGGRWRAGPDEEPSEWPAGVQLWAERDEELDDP